MPMGSAGLPNPRPNNGPMASFAQAMGGSSQPATPLDLTEFPSLSNHPTQQSHTANQSTWATAGSRGLGPISNARLQHANLNPQQLSSHSQGQQQQDDLFRSSSQVPGNQSGFRFGNQNAIGQSSQTQPTTTEEFPPLGRNGAVELQNAGFGGQGNSLAFGSTNMAQSNRSNGLLDALSGNSRLAPVNRVTSPASISGISASRSPIDTSRQGLGGGPDDIAAFPNGQFSLANPLISRDESIGSASGGPLQTEGQSQKRGSLTQRSTALDDSVEASQDGGESVPDAQDPLAGMSDMDRWGLKGITYMMNNYPDYAAVVAGTEFNTMGFDLEEREPISSQIYSLFDNELARPTVPSFTNPECYRVHNVASVDSKMPNFNDESLLFMFYNNPNDIQQVMAAQELNNRNWRFHKKLQLWLTKDLDMQPQQLSGDTERGYYVFFDWKLWQRERRELTLKYSDLETLTNVP
ncbi:hypothetical protein BP6252_04361 [Coleophoma cylindrospora]|uniref:NOT2/NOT3/NOT5 C-terminal domain-containing protein n=1 Tax=Coleophoma cylindrospora TaxID=1849047 RepID=A0A3D8S097_9HELO|nr:hypothetical protein BP6252_04361 [Coleophoma cylindrospora]